jgi:undecaprenyl-diphosphatase
MILGIVDGLSEYLPVSPDGHLTIVQGLLGLWAEPDGKSSSDAYTILIQAGAIIAIFMISFGRIKDMFRGIFSQNQEGVRLFGNVVVSFILAALIRLVLEKTVKHYLNGLWPVAVAWVVGGIFILLALVRWRGKEGLRVEDLRWRNALMIGLAQILS